MVDKVKRKQKELEQNQKELEQTQKEMEQEFQLKNCHDQLNGISERIAIDKNLVFLQRDSGLQGTTHLHRAATDGDICLVRSLIESGADVNSENNELERKPLHLAVENGHVDCARLLIESRATIDPEDRNLETPLHLAARNGHIDCVRLLIACGSDFLSENRLGQTAVDVVRYDVAMEKKEEIIKIIQFVRKKCDSARRCLMFCRLFSSVRRANRIRRFLVFKLVCWEMVRNKLNPSEFEEFFGKTTNLSVQWRHLQKMFLRGRSESFWRLFLVRKMETVFVEGCQRESDLLRLQFSRSQGFD